MHKSRCSSHSLVVLAIGRLSQVRFGYCNRHISLSTVRWCTNNRVVSSFGRAGKLHLIISRFEFCLFSQKYCIQKDHRISSELNGYYFNFFLIRINKDKLYTYGLLLIIWRLVRGVDSLSWGCQLCLMNICSNIFQAVCWVWIRGKIKVYFRTWWNPIFLDFLIFVCWDTFEFF